MNLRGVGVSDIIHMTAWLRPTRLTWLTLALLPAIATAVVAGFLALGNDLPGWLLILLAIDRPFTLWEALGVPVGRRGDYWGFAFPNALGWTLIVSTDLAVLYVAASVVAALWRKARGAAARRRGRGTMD
jgi:hypothetical protein